MILIQKEFAMSNIDKIIKQYKISNQNILYFKLRNSFFRIPSDDKIQMIKTQRSPFFL